MKLTTVVVLFIAVFATSAAYANCINVNGVQYCDNSQMPAPAPQQAPMLQAQPPVMYAPRPTGCQPPAYFARDYYGRLICRYPSVVYTPYRYGPYYYGPAIVGAGVAIGYGFRGGHIGGGFHGGGRGHR